MSEFEYIIVFTSIILGLAVVNLLGGISIMLDEKIKTKLYWVHLVWTGNVFLITSLVWWNNMVLKDNEEFNFLHFMDLIDYSIVIYFMSGLLFPIKHKKINDYKEHFNRNRVRFYIVGICLGIVDGFDAWLGRNEVRGGLEPEHIIYIGIFILIFAIGAYMKNEKADKWIAVIMMISLCAWAEETIRLGFA